jgi:hypothetical protein
LIQNKEDGKLVEIPGPDERDGEEEVLWLFGITSD